jgi:hypothetical protein
MVSPSAYQAISSPSRTSRELNTRRKKERKKKHQRNQSALPKSEPGRLTRTRVAEQGTQPNLSGRKRTVTVTLSLASGASSGNSAASRGEVAGEAGCGESFPAGAGEAFRCRDAMGTAAGGDLAERGGARHWRGRGLQWVGVNRRRGARVRVVVSVGLSAFAWL